MNLRLLKPLRLLGEALSESATPRQMALGFALGMVIGLVPKGNLTAAALMVVLLGSRVNLGMGLAGAMLFSWIGVLTDPVAHRVGHALLARPSLRPMWAWLYDLPVVPWTGFNNTVVLGSLLIGLGLFYPAWRVSERAFARIQPPLCARLAKYRIVQLLAGTELVAGWRAE
jgi:uncharacterized protein (TIGR03546 family)